MPMVKGYSELHSGGLESLYAWHPNGNVYSCRFIPQTRWFNKPGRKWTLCRGLPTNAAFIGNFQMETM